MLPVGYYDVRGHKNGPYPQRTAGVLADGNQANDWAMGWNLDTYAYYHNMHQNIYGGTFWCPTTWNETEAEEAYYQANDVNVETDPDEDPDWKQSEGRSFTHWGPTYCAPCECNLGFRGHFCDLCWVDHGVLINGNTTNTTDGGGQDPAAAARRAAAAAAARLLERRHLEHALAPNPARVLTKMAQQQRRVKPDFWSKAGQRLLKEILVYGNFDSATWPQIDEKVCS